MNAADKALTTYNALAAKLEKTRTKKFLPTMNIDLFISTQKAEEKRLVWAMNDLAIDFHQDWNAG